MLIDAPMMVEDRPIPQGTHQVDVTPGGDRVIIRDLDLFIGHDPEFDGEDARFKPFDEDTIKDIVTKTRALMASRGQSPKLHVGHNPDDPDTPEQESVGDIVAVRFGRIGGAPAIFGDAEMDRGDFDHYVASNRFPRRSAEVDRAASLLLSVALLGSRAPARALRDTKFSEDKGETFVRDSGIDRFAYSTAGPGNVAPPKTTEAKTMADDKTLDDLKAKCKAQADEIKELKAKMKAKAQDDDEDKTKAMDDETDKASEDEKDEKATKAGRETAAVLRAQRDDLTKRLDARNKELADLTVEVVTEKFGRMIDSDIAAGELVLTESARETLMERIVNASDKAARDAEYQFAKDLSAKAPIGVVVRRDGIEIPRDKGDNDRLNFARETKAAKLVQDGDFKSMDDALKAIKDGDVEVA